MYDALKDFTREFKRSELLKLAGTLLSLPDKTKDVHAYCYGIQAAQAGKHEPNYHISKDPVTLQAFQHGHRQFLYANGELVVPESNSDAD